MSDKMSNSLAATAAVIPGLEYAALMRQPKRSSPKKPYLNNTASETTLVEQSQNGTSQKTKEKGEDLDSDAESTMTATEKSPEKTLSSSITKAAAKVKSKLKGGSSSPKGSTSTQRGTILNPSSMQTWQALAEFK